MVKHSFTMPISAFELSNSRLPRPSHNGESSSPDEFSALLPTSARSANHHYISPREVTEVCVRLRLMLDEIIPIEIKETRISRPGSTSIITPAVVETALAAADGDRRACIVFALLTVKMWYGKLERRELCDADLYSLKAEACAMIAKRIIEEEQDQDFLFKEMLCRRFSLIVDNEVTDARNALELAVDIHSLTVIGSSGYQKCISWIWHGWIVPSPVRPSEYVSYTDVAVPDFWTHFNPDRIKTPLYQNGLQLAFSIVYLALYTGAVNTANPGGNFDPVEGLLYVFTLGFLFDEIVKFYHIGIYYFSFWSVFNDTLYGLLIVSFVFRIIALSVPDNSSARHSNDVLAYQFLAFCAPLMWSRLLLFLDMQKFFGAMLVVVKELMKESVVFFVLLIIIMIGFLQAFVGLDSADGYLDTGAMSISYMVRSVLQSPEFEPFEMFAPPFGALLNYIFTFVVSVLLLNILIALFNSAYEKVYDNAVDEFLALFAQKTLRFVRAPDENVFVPPLNLIEIFGLILPFEWWMPKHRYARLNDYVMTVVYSPVLVLISAYEVYVAGCILRNRASGEEDDDTQDEWEYPEIESEVGASDWLERVREASPHADLDPATYEIRQLKKQVDELTAVIAALKQDLGGGKKRAESTTTGGDTENEIENETETLLDVDSNSRSSE
ncbi:hypothetical protein BZA70DRAFT_281820 [Myxozyma melibiosi]|uniref:Ion transport domain-containing protein n=1 Tax=Myxozyma melibiosi TaxID=54550 RepID=A0ABR1F549_9ASCO